MGRERWVRILNRLELTRRSGTKLEPFIVQQAVECAEALGSLELAADWVAASGRSAIEIFCSKAGGGDTTDELPALLEPSAVLAPLSPGGAVVQLHGVRHSDCARGIARAIVRAAPATVALECAAEDAMPGMALERARACRAALLAAELSRSRGDGQSALSWLSSAGWRDVLRSASSTESLAVVSAWACGARVVAIDRPKHITWARCLGGHSLRELDLLFEQKVVTGGPSCRFVLREREVVMASALATLSRPTPAAGGARSAPPIVAIVGSAHVAPLCALWGELASDPSAMARLALEAAATLAEPPAAARRAEPRGGTAGALDERASSASASQQLGAKYALLDAIFAPSARPSRHLPPLSGPAADAYRLTLACYSGADMSLAVLPEEQLRAAVMSEQASQQPDADSAHPCSARDGEAARALAGAVWQSLAPMRAARPSNGGPGW